MGSVIEYDFLDDRLRRTSPVMMAEMQTTKILRNQDQLQSNAFAKYYQGVMLSQEGFGYSQVFFVSTTSSTSSTG